MWGFSAPHLAWVDALTMQTLHELDCQPCAANRTPVESYAQRGKNLWANRVLPHGWSCGCLRCVDYREELGHATPAGQLVPAPQRREERSA